MNNRSITRCLYTALLALLVVHCKKEEAVHPDSSLPARPMIFHILDSVDNFSLFSYALKKANLDTAVTPDGNYTCFAIDNSGMTGAGFTKDALDRLLPDSLQKIFRYHIAIGGFPDSILAQSVSYAAIQSIKQNISFIPGLGYRIYRYYLYARLQDNKLYINAQPVNNGEKALQAGNGWVYPVSRLFRAPEKNLLGTIQSRPELSLYYTALRIMDSLYNSVRSATTPFPKILDSNFLASEGLDFQVLNGLFVSGRNLFSLPTVLAPVNDAFIKAGLTNARDIRNFCLKRPVDDIKKSKYIGLDSVLKNHILYSPLDLYYNFIFYNQFADGPSFNNKVHNVSLYSRILSTSFPSGTNAWLQFSLAGDTVTIVPSGNSNLPPARLIKSGSDILATNGIIHEVDRLMPPIP